MKQGSIVHEDLQLIAALVERGLKDRGIPLVKPATFARSEREYGIHPLWLARFSFGAVPTVLEFPWGDETHDLRSVLTTAEDITSALERLHTDREVFSDIFEGVRSIARKEVAKATRRGLPWKLLKLEPTPVSTWRDDLPAVTVIIEMLDGALRPMQFRVQCESADELASELSRVSENQKERAELRTTYAAHGATTLIDAVTLAAIRRSGEDLADVVRGTTDGGRRTIDVDGEPTTLLFEDGSLIARVSLAPNVVWDGHRASDGTTKLTKKRNLAGKPLSTILASPLVDDRVIIRSISRHAGSTDFWCDSGFVLFDEVSGEIKAEF